MQIANFPPSVRVPSVTEVLAVTAYSVSATAAVNGNYAAISDNGNDRVYVFDGTTWTSTNPSITNLSAIALKSDGSAIVLCDSTAAGTSFRRSTDGGANWANVTNPTTGNAITKMLCGGSTFIGIKDNQTSTEIARSTDSGATFSAVSVTSGAYTAIATDGAGTWILYLSQSASIRSSDDGANWSTITLPTGATQKSFWYSGGKFRLITGTGNYYYSTDGTTGSWSAAIPVGTYPTVFPTTSNLAMACNGNYLYALDNGYLRKINTEAADVVCTTTGGGLVSATNLLYVAGNIYTMSTTSTVHALSLVKISNVP